MYLIYVLYAASAGLTLAWAKRLYKKKKAEEAWEEWKKIHVKGTVDPDLSPEENEKNWAEAKKTPLPEVDWDALADDELN